MDLKFLISVATGFFITAVGFFFGVWATFYLIRRRLKSSGDPYPDRIECLFSGHLVGLTQPGGVMASCSRCGRWFQYKKWGQEGTLVHVEGDGFRFVPHKEDTRF